MNKTIYTLSGLLALQVVLAVGLNMSSQGFAGEAASTKLLSFPASKVTRLVITGADGKSVVLAKKGKSWTLPRKGGFPAAAHKVDSLIKDLAKAEEGAPVATSSGAPKRFRVAKAAFERKLVFGPEKSPLATVYLGNSQGARQVYVRRGGQSGVRLMDFGLYRVSANTSDWVDSNALKLDATKIKSIAWNKVKILRAPAKAADAAPKMGAKTADAKVTASKSAAKAKAAPGWELQIAGHPARPLKAAAVQSLTDQLGSMWILGLAPGKPQAAAGDPKLDLKVMLDGGKSLDYRLLKQKDGSYLVAASNLPKPVKLSDTSAKGLIKATGDKAFAPPAAPAAPAAAAAPTPANTATPTVTSGG